MGEERITLDVFGRELLAIRKQESWQLFYTGSEGKRRPATDIVVEDGLSKEQLVQELADLLHEWARPGFDEVKITSQRRCIAVVQAGKAVNRLEG